MDWSRRSARGTFAARCRDGGYEFYTRLTDNKNFPKDWTDFLTKYSMCELSFETDRLVAIAGLVPRLKLRLPEEDFRYHYGVWSHQVELDLVWIAPSWSWASHNGPILYRVHWYDEPLIEIIEFPKPALYAGENVDRAPLVVRGCITPLYGVRNRLQTVPDVIARGPYGNLHHIELHELLDRNIRVVGWLSLDQGFDSVDTKKLVNLPVFWKYKSKPYSSLHSRFVLVLFENERKLEYTRVGIGYVSAVDSLNTAPMTEIIIV